LSKGIKVINWSGDVRRDIQWYKDLGKHITVTSFSNETDCEHLSKEGLPVEYLQIGYDHEIYSPEGNKRNTEEIVFMGNNYSSFDLSLARREMVEFLKAQYGSRFGVYGFNWKFASGNLNNDQVTESEILRSAKIVINMSQFHYKRYSSDRLFRILGSGRLAMCHKYPGMEKDFIDGENIVSWETLDDLKQKIDWYLENDEERERIASNGYIVGSNNFTLDHVINNIICMYCKYAEHCIVW
jgi:spore maturation protein CgeB